MTLFDAYIFVDWSARNDRGPLRPAADALWVGELPPPEDQDQREYFRTRQETIDYVLGRLLCHVQQEHRVLLGFDFPYGYPKGLALSLCLPRGGAPWWSVWTELSIRIRDGADNRNNRFPVASDLNNIISAGNQGPFWGCPTEQVTQHLSTHMPVFPFPAANGITLQSLRLCESVLPGVQEAWGLLGAGRVGSQSLTGIPRVHFLRHHPELAAISKVWPFETGFTSTPASPGGPFVLHAEIWPGVVGALVHDIGLPIRDQAQVRAMCQWARGLDEGGELRARFDTPAGLHAAQVQECVEEEGWILGA